MEPSSQVAEILPGVFRWQAHSAEHKVELTSHAVQQGSELLLFDPIPVSAESLDWFPPVPPTAMVLTNGNHLRAAVEWRERFNVPIFAAAEAGIAGSGVHELTPGRLPFAGWQAVRLAGGPAGETAFLLPAKSLVVFGDAVVNLPGRGLEVLPAKYCTDQKRLRASLRELLGRTDWTSAVFAHGAPLLGDARDRINAIL